MKNTPKPDISGDVQTLPYMVFEIRVTAVIDGRKVPFVCVGIAQTGEIEQAVAELQGEDSPLGIVLRRCLEAASGYNVDFLGWAPDIQSAEDLRRQKLADYPLALNHVCAPNRGDSIHLQDLRKLVLEAEDCESGTKKCASCGAHKELKEFNKNKGELRDDCKLCLDEANLRGLTPSEHREHLINGWALPPRRSAAASKKCYCCGKVKERKEFGANKRTSDLLNPSCRACTSERNRRGILMKDLRDEKQRLGSEGEQVMVSADELLERLDFKDGMVGVILLFPGGYTENKAFTRDDFQKLADRCALKGPDGRAYRAGNCSIQKGRRIVKIKMVAAWIA